MSSNVLILLSIIMPGALLCAAVISTYRTDVERSREQI